MLSSGWLAIVQWVSRRCACIYNYSFLLLLSNRFVIKGDLKSTDGAFSEVGKRPVSRCRRPVNIRVCVCIESLCQRPVNDLSISTPPGAPTERLSFFVSMHVSFMVHCQERAFCISRTKFFFFYIIYTVMLYTRYGGDRAP